MAYIALILVVVALCLFGEKIDRGKLPILALIGLVLTVFSMMRGMDVSRDDRIFGIYYNQSYPLAYLANGLKSFFASAKVEPTFILLSSVFKTFFPHYGFQCVLAFYAVFAIYLKMKAISRYSDFIFLSLLTYLCNYYFLHDMTQIRAGLAVGIALLSFKPLIHREFWKFACYIALASIFHYSCLIFFFLYFLNTKKINLWLYLCILFVPLLLVRTGFDPTSILLKYDFGVYSEKVREYKEIESWQNAQINVFNLPILFLIALSLFLLYYRKELAEKNEYGIILLKMNIISIAIFFLFSGLVAFAFRLYEIIGVAQIFLIPYIVYFVKPRWLAELFVVLVNMAILFNLLVRQGLMSEYHWFI